MDTQLTPRQRNILAFIRESITEHGYPPTLREIGHAFGIRSTNGVNDHLRALERKGLIRREGLKSRGLQICDPVERSSVHTGELYSIPLLGDVSAGQLSEAIEHTESFIHMDAQCFTQGQPSFALRIRGESMIEKGIMNDDIVFVRRQQSAQPGEIIIARIDDETSCKLYYPEQEGVRLQPANQHMEAIRIPHSDWRDNCIVGVVTGVYRRI